MKMSEEDKARAKELIKKAQSDLDTVDFQKKITQTQAIQELASAILDIGTIPRSHICGIITERVKDIVPPKFVREVLDDFFKTREEIEDPKKLFGI